MPICPPKTPKDRDRWEEIAGKALKDWVTRVMKTTHKTRAEARYAILKKINGADLL